MEGGGGCEAKAGTEGTPLQAADSQTLLAMEKLSSRLDMASATLKRAAVITSMRPQESSPPSWGRREAQESPCSDGKLQGHISATATSLLCTSTLLLVHTAKKSQRRPHC